MGLAKRIAKNAKAIRIQHGLSQQDLANKTGLTVRYISRLENTSPNITIDVVERLSKGLGCTINALIGPDIKQPDSEFGKGLEQTIRFLQSLKSRI